jgi:type IV pilus assembly protein PilM
MILQVNKQNFYSPIGIDFGNSQIKMIQLRHSNGKPLLWQKAMCSTPVGSIIEGSIAEPEILAGQLQKLFRTIPWKGKQVNCSLPGQAAHSAIVTLPMMNARQVNQAMRLQAEMLFPVEADAVEISYCPVNFSIQYHCSDQPKNLKEQYLLTVVSKETLKVCRGIIENAGFSLHSFETPIGSLIRSISQAWELSSPADRSTAERAVIDFGGKSTTVLIINRDGLVKFKIIAYGCDDFKQVILRKWPTLKNKAKQALFSAGSLSDKGLLPLTHQLTDAIRKIVAYPAGPLNSSTSAACPSVIVCGGGVYIPGLAGHLQKELGISFSVYNPLLYLGAEVNTQNRLQLNEASLFAAAHGLALRH